MRLGVRFEFARREPPLPDDYWTDETRADLFLDMVGETIVGPWDNKDGTLSPRHIRVNLSDPLEDGAIPLRINELENNVFCFRGNKGSFELLDPGESVEIATKDNPKEIRVRVTNISC